MQIEKAYFRSLVHSSQKLCPKPDSGNFAPCILPCKIGGSQNLMKERYLSKTPFLTFVYLSKCNIKLPGYFGNSKKRFLWTGLLCMYVPGVNMRYSVKIIVILGTAAECVCAKFLQNVASLRGGWGKTHDDGGAQCHGVCLLFLLQTKAWCRSAGMKLKRQLTNHSFSR